MKGRRYLAVFGPIASKLGVTPAEWIDLLQFDSDNSLAALKDRVFANPVAEIASFSSFAWIEPDGSVAEHQTLGIFEKLPTGEWQDKTVRE